MTDQQIAAEQAALIIDQLTVSAGLATALLQAMTALEQRMAKQLSQDPMQHFAKQIRERDTLLRREIAEARAARDKAEAIIAKQQNELVALRKRVRGAPKMRKRGRK